MIIFLECKGDIRGSNICINNMQKNLHKSIEGKSGGSPPMEIGEAIVDEIINAIFRGDLICKYFFSKRKK